MRLIVLLVAIISKNKARESVIAVIREYDLEAQPMLTFILSTVKKYGENRICGFGESRLTVFGTDILNEFPVENPKLVTSLERSYKARTQSVLVGMNPVLRDLFFNRLPNVQIEYMNGQDQVVATSDKVPKNYEISFKERPDETTNFIWFSEKSEVFLCFYNEIIYANLVAIVVVEEYLNDFNLSFNQNGLLISKIKNTRQDYTPLSFASRVFRLKERKSRTHRDLKSNRFSVGGASAIGKLNLDEKIDPLVDDNLRVGIKKEFKKVDLSTHLVIKHDDKVIFIMPKPEHSVKVFFYIDGFSTGDYFETVPPQSKTFSSEKVLQNSCPIKSIGAGLMIADHYAVLIECKVSELLIV